MRDLMVENVIKIPVEEAIYYLEEVLRDSSKVYECVSSRAPMFMTWWRKVNNILEVIYGKDSETLTTFLSETPRPYQDGLLCYLTFAVNLLRGCVRTLKHQFSQNVFSRECFVAMWFDESTEEVYHTGIYNPLKHLGYNSIRVDKIEHNDRIDQKIFELIRKSRFVVADFSGNRAGVYYEAGFASGMGLPVIHICRSEDFDKRHFDVLTKNTIKYTSPSDLATQLTKRVQGTIDANWQG